MGLPSGEKTMNDLPNNFCFTTDDPYYSGPATCNLLHYTPAAYMAGFIEMAMLASGSLWFWQLHSVNQSMDTWAMLFMFALTFGGLVTTLLMFYGLKTEQAKLISPKLAFIQLEITILMMLAAVAIVAMSFGISLTHQLFSVFVKVPEMERDFGPIWPFNISVISFFAAALCVW
ncbi:hypothetical protein TELCIR_09989 [Teladorsagia circumcincta]|uniref:Uncharacterized protein n=1 Tax=Teladorsagia circumcincta TaxID=45464 RepID=A0A2G9UDE0_TELCI|nr:hypothetical protein TELCIR_09989 [Teladorsagia circumcincta]